MGAASPRAWAEACRATSGNATAAVIELFTSEGCDSCPPADRWLSRIEQELQGRTVVPVAFHVDYWDRLGWKDRFGSPAFTARQHEQMERHNGSFVYTPQVLLQGRDFRDWQSAGRLQALVTAINKQAPRASIALTAATVEGKVEITVSVHVTKAEDRARSALVVALTQNGLSSDVAAGENAGKRLPHDYVVRSWRSGFKPDAAGNIEERLRLDIPSDRGPVSVVAFLEDTREGGVLQAVALPLCGAPS